MYNHLARTAIYQNTTSMTSNEHSSKTIQAQWRGVAKPLDKARFYSTTTVRWSKRNYFHPPTSASGRASMVAGFVLSKLFSEIGSTVDGISSFIASLPRSLWSLVPGPWSLVPGPWVPVPGPCPWSLVAGPWSLVGDHWSLINDHWSLINDNQCNPWLLIIDHNHWSLINDH